MRRSWLIILMLVLSLFLYSGNSNPDMVMAQSSTNIVRIEGASRFETAVKLSQAAYPNGVDIAYIANATTMVDALSVGPVAGGPILLTSTNALPESTQQELARLQPSTVVILGGRAAVSSYVEEQIRATLSSGGSASADPEQRMVDLTNQERTEVLSRAADMDEVAENWSQTMEEDRQLKHNPNYKEQICCWSRLTENVGFTTLQAPGDMPDALVRVHNGFMNSPRHRDNILDPGVSEVGTGVVTGDCPDGMEAPNCVWVTMNFRERR